MVSNARQIYSLIHRDDPFCFFLGAGFSIGKIMDNGQRDGLGTGNEVAKYLIEKFDLPIPADFNPTLRWVVDECHYINSATLRTRLSEYFDAHGKVQESHRILANILGNLEDTRELVFSVNVDKLLEDAYYNENYGQLRVARNDDYYFKSNNDYSLIKLHGCQTEMHETVWTTEDYFRIHKKDALFDKLRMSFRTKSVIFIGFAMEDIDIMDLLYKLRPEGGFSRPNFLVIPANDFLTSSKCDYLQREFRITHIPMTAEDFMKGFLDETIKKKSKNIVLSEIRALRYDSILSSEKLLAFVDWFPLVELNNQERAVILYHQLRKFNNEGNAILNRLSPQDRLDVFLILGSYNSELLSHIDFIEIPLRDREVDLIPIIKKCSSQILKNFISSFDVQNSELISSIFARLTEKELTEQRIIQILLGRGVSAVTGAIQSSNKRYIRELLGFNGLSLSALNVLEIRLQQLNGNYGDIMMPDNDEYCEAYGILEEFRKELKVNQNLSWPLPNCDCRNSSSTKFNVGQKLQFIWSTKAKDISRPLIARGTICFKDNENYFIQSLGTKEKIELPEAAELAVFYDSYTVSFRDSQLWAYDENGYTKLYKILNSDIVYSPKIYRDKLIIVLENGEVHILDKELHLNQYSENMPPGVLDYVIESSNIFAVYNTGITKLDLDTKELKSIPREINDLKSTCCSNEILYLWSETYLYAFVLDTLEYIDQWQLPVTPTTNIVVLSKNAIAFGAGRQLYVVYFDRTPHLIEDMGNGIIADIIFCGESLIVTLENGKMLSYNWKAHLFEEIDHCNQAVRAKKISAGEGLVCINSGDEIVVLGNSA